MCGYLIMLAKPTLLETQEKEIISPDHGDVVESDITITFSNLVRNHQRWDVYTMHYVHNVLCR